MNAFKKLLAAALALAMLLALCACGDDDQKDNTNQTNGTTSSANNGDKIDYQVKILDGQGNPMTTGVVVKFLQNGKQVAMQVPNANGVATKNLAKGNYTVELTFTDGNQKPSYDTSAAVLSADKPSLTLTLINELSKETQSLFVNDQEYIAYHVNAGNTNVPVTASVRNYFIFAPTMAGTYTFSIDNPDIKIGYYGGPHFVKSLSAVDPINNVITLSISAGSIGSAYVIGLDGLNTDSAAALSIVRTGDPSITISDMPWTEYKTTHTPAPYTLSIPSGKSLKYVDIMGKTEDNQVVFNESDGYYHYGSANGPVVLVHLGVGAPYCSLQYILNLDGKFGQHGAPIREYFFDKNGNFLKKEDYGDILRKYFENMDKSAGVYPLTKDLEYIIKNGCHGWWDKDDPDYIFTDCNPEIGWMFALCYVG